VIRMPRSIEEAKARLHASTQPAASHQATRTAVAVQKASRKPAAKGKADVGRWATLNAFHDLCKPLLGSHEREVWEHLFRHARDGIATASTRQIAEHHGFGLWRVTAALKVLIEAGLVWPVALSKHKGSASRYGLNPKPSNCVPKLMEMSSRGQGGSKYGKRTVSKLDTVQ
jgi:hypothetical protein